MGGISEAGTMCPAGGALNEDNEGFEESGGVGYARIGGVPIGVATRECVVSNASATVGDWRGDCAGMSCIRAFTIKGGNSGVLANRSASGCSGSMSTFSTLTMSTGEEVMTSPRRSLLLLADARGNFSLRSNAWCVMLVIEDDRVDDTRDGVALRDVRPKDRPRLRIFRDREGNLLSNLLAMLLTVDSVDLRRLGEF